MVPVIVPAYAARFHLLPAHFQLSSVGWSDSSIDRFSLRLDGFSEDCLPGAGSATGSAFPSIRCALRGRGRAKIQPVVGVRSPAALPTD